MNRFRGIALTLSAAVALAGTTGPLRASGGAVIPLYPSGSVTSLGVPEVHETMDGETMIYDVSEPTLEVFRPAAGKANGTAVIVAPGGGFVALGYRYGGTDVAQALARRGITALVLKYRTIRSGDGPMRMPAVHMKEMGVVMARAKNGTPTEMPRFAGEPHAVEDGARAMAIVRHRAREWGIDPHKVGVLGFSAGSYLAADLAIGAKATRPDFVGLIYGGLRTPVPVGASPAFIAGASDDEYQPNDPMLLYAAWHSAGGGPSVPAWGARVRPPTQRDDERPLARRVHVVARVKRLRAESGPVSRGRLQRRTAACLLAGAASCVAFAAPAVAQVSASKATPTPDAARVTDDPGADIVVTGYRYLDVDTSGITNLPLPIEKVPQSISLLNSDFVKAADVRTIADVAQYTTGGLWASYVPSYGSTLLLRGLPASFAVDGIVVGTPGDPLFEPDRAMIGRYEVVKGPASVVYGAEGPGGLVNLQLKDAGPHTPSYVEALGGSFGRWRLEGQIAGALNAAGTIRAIGVAAHEEGGSFVDFVHLNKTVVYGGLDADLTSDLKAYARASYQRTADTPYNGIPVYADASLPKVPYDYFIGGSAFEAVGKTVRVDAGLAWTPGALWSFDLKGLWQRTTHDGANSYSAGYLAADGSFPISGEVFNDWSTHDATIAASAVRKLDDLGLTGSTVSASLRYQHYVYDINESFRSGTGNVNLSDRALSDLFNSAPLTGGGYRQREQLDYLTASVQALIKPVQPVTLLGGVSWSRPRIKNDTFDGPVQNLSPGGQVSARAGVIVEPVGGLNLYAAYSESYQPNLRLDVDSNVLAPLDGKQVEIGAKYISPGRRLLLTAALFSLKESNVPQYAATIDNETYYRGQGVRHRGVELEATGQVTRSWQVRGGLALLDATVTSDPANPVNNGDTRPWLPKVTANLFTTYAWANGFSVSAGGRYVGPEKTYDRSSAHTPELPHYLLVDAGLGYTVGRWHAQLNLKNIGDKRYYIAPYDTYAYGLYPGEPRSVAVSLRRDF